MVDQSPKEANVSVFLTAWWLYGHMPSDCMWTTNCQTSWYPYIMLANPYLKMAMDHFTNGNWAKMQSTLYYCCNAVIGWYTPLTNTALSIITTFLKWKMYAIV